MVSRLLAAENKYVRNRLLFLAALGLALLGPLLSCGGKVKHPTSPPRPARSYRMGFSAIPARPDLGQALAALDLWTRRADAAILHFEPPWDTLLKGAPIDSAVLLVHKPLVDYYRAKGLIVVVTLDVTNGLDRSAESPALVAAGRSLAEPAVQQILRGYAVAVDTILRPTTLLLAAETNLIRAAASPTIYSAVVQAANGAAADIRALDAAVQLGVSVQVETAWGRLSGGGSFVGIATDLADFPFVQAIGLSSYPYLGGFDDPEQIPLDYYSRITPLPKLVVEGGWASVSVGPVVTSQEEQARYIRRHMQLLDQASAVAVFQLTFTDLDPAYFPPGTILPLFATLGLVDMDLAPKRALAPWDSAFARPRR
ncbi:MAG TPA: hypothetical protein VFQ05_00790 [Candidatus Eisenbacteria bacterium]|nr:hypothetical protein [Candidatus Eisenbacteria bacterium]